MIHNRIEAVPLPAAEWTPEAEIERLESELQQQIALPILPNGLTNPLNALQPQEN